MAVISTLTVFFFNVHAIRVSANQKYSLVGKILLNNGFGAKI